ncbi:MAG TPA: hypothetical protein VFB50_21320 [Chloroflexota bacterium]|nr:hypothetical protein [Chloroflexota bacterium]
MPPTIIGPQSRSVKRLDIQADMFLRILQGMDGDRLVRCEGIPADARSVGIIVDEAWNTVVVYVESTEFEPVAEGMPVPHLDVRFTEHFTPVSAS